MTCGRGHSLVAMRHVYTMSHEIWEEGERIVALDVCVCVSVQPKHMSLCVWFYRVTMGLSLRKRLLLVMMSSLQYQLKLMKL